MSRRLISLKILSVSLLFSIAFAGFVPTFPKQEGLCWFKCLLLKTSFFVFVWCIISILCLPVVIVYSFISQNRRIAGVTHLWSLHSMAPPTYHQPLLALPLQAR
jgi:type III secretory pathway component EscU